MTQSTNIYLNNWNVSPLMYCSSFFFKLVKVLQLYATCKLWGYYWFVNWLCEVLENCDTWETKGTSYSQNSYSVNAYKYSEYVKLSLKSKKAVIGIWPFQKWDQPWNDQSVQSNIFSKFKTSWDDKTSIQIFT